MSGQKMTRCRRRIAEITDDVNAHRAGSTARVAAFGPGQLNVPDRLCDRHALSSSDLAQRAPELWFQAHARPSIKPNDIAVDQSTLAHR